MQEPYSTNLGIPDKLFAIEDIEPEKILGARTIAYHMGADKFTLQRKQGEHGIEYGALFLADSYTGRDIGEKIVNNGYAALVKSYDNSLDLSPKRLDEKLDKNYIV